MDLSKIIVLNEADDLFDIDKEVDAQIKRVENRLSKKEEDTTPEEPIESEQTEPQEDNVEAGDVEEGQEVEPTQDDKQEESEYGQSNEYKYMNDKEGDEEIPDDYEPKQTIPELRVLKTLSDSEYSLCNIRIIEDFRELRKNIESTINNILMNVSTKDAKQRQVVDIVHKNLYDMLEDINNYIMFKNNDVYEENVIAYLTYLKRYQIATNLIRMIVNENLKYHELKK